MQDFIFLYPCWGEALASHSRRHALVMAVFRRVMNSSFRQLSITTKPLDFFSMPYGKSILRFHQPYGSSALLLFTFVISLVLSLENHALSQFINRSSNRNTITWPLDTPGNVNYTVKSGLKISVNTKWVGARGYRPLKFTISSAQPTASNLQITIRFSAGPNREKENSIFVEQDLELRQGKSSVTGTALIPQYMPWGNFHWEVWIDGKKDEELSPTSIFTPQSIGETGFAGLFVTSHNRGSYFQRNNFLDIMEYPEYQLPESWTHYSSFDLVILYPEDLIRWKTTSPERFSHLIRWLLAGGNLWIVETGSNYEKLEEIEKLLDLPPSRNSTSEDPLEQHGWMALEYRETPMESVEAALLLEGLKKEDVPKDPSSQEADEEEAAEEEIVKTSRSRFVTRGFGMGTITASQHLIGKTTFDIHATRASIDRTFLRRRFNWASRHGNDPSRGNYEFGKFLIPDVGTAPVIEFQLLISFFVILIGPLNYWLLRRRHQLPLMLVTVPIVALATTLFLFAYGFMADGFGVRVRVRSVTTLDQKRGEAISWARLSYYAGLAPSEGLTVPNDTVVYPILPARADITQINRQNQSLEREVVWDNQQHLTRGWLASRTPTQYLTISARASKKRLAFRQANDNVTVANHLQTDIKLLFVRDQDGQFYLNRDINKDESIPLTKSNPQETILELRKIVSDNEPEYPPGLEVAQVNRRRSRRNRSPQQDPTQLQSLLDNTINASISPLSDGLAPGTYLAITSEAPEVALGLEEVTESASFHIVRGSWTYD